MQKDLPRVRIELTTLRLWDLRAAYCATEAGDKLVKMSYSIPQCIKKLMWQ